MLNFQGVYLTKNQTHLGKYTVHVDPLGKPKTSGDKNPSEMEPFLSIKKWLFYGSMSKSHLFFHVKRQAGHQKSGWISGSRRFSAIFSPLGCEIPRGLSLTWNPRSQKMSAVILVIIWYPGGFCFQ